MSGKMKSLFVVSLIGLLALPALMRAGKPAKAVFLKASFRDANNNMGYPLDKIRSDGKGVYQNAADLTVMINSDRELVFDIGERSGRRVDFLFDDYLRYGNCSEQPPDTTGTDPLIPDEPVNYVHFHTHMESYMGGPKVDFLEMQPKDIKEVRFWIVFTTAVRSFFYVNHDQTVLNSPSGLVLVKAIDLQDDPGTPDIDEGDGIVDRWVLYPKPDTQEMANFHRKALSGKDKGDLYDFGDFRMPFMLILDR